MGHAVLVAEDNVVSRELLMFQLGLLGCDAVGCESGLDAAAAWRIGRYTLLLTDLDMPGLDGYGLASLIRSEERTERMPIIALTAGHGGGDHDGDAARCATFGIDACILKPPSVATLRGLVERWVVATT